MLLSLAACGPKTGGEDTANNPMSLDPKAHMLQVEGKWISQLTGSISEALGAYSAEQVSTGIKADMTLRVGEKLQQLLGGSDMDLSFLESIGLNMDIKVKDDLMKYLADIELNDTKLGTLDMVMDTVSQKAWLGLPGLTDKYIETSLAGTQDGMGSATAMMSAETLKQFAELLPDATKLETVLQRYLMMVYEGVPEVKRQEQVLELNGLKQDVVVLEYTVTEKDLAKLVKTILEKAKQDTDLKALLEEFQEKYNDLMEESYGAQWQDVDLYNQMLDVIDDALESLTENTEYKESNYITEKIYLDKSFNVIGRYISMTTEGELDIELYAKQVTQGNAFAMEMALQTSDVISTIDNVGYSKLAISGEGTIKDGAHTGKLTLAMANSEKTLPLLEMELKDVAQSGERGELKLDPSAQLLTMLMGEDAAVLDFGLQMKWSVEGKKASYTVDVLMNDLLLAGLDISIDESTGSDIAKPGSGAVTQDMQEWMAGLDMQKLLQNLQTAGVPEALLNSLMGQG